MQVATEQPTLEITDHFEVKGRGAIVFGHVRAGVFRIGMRVSGQPGFEPLTIASVEFADSIAERTYRTGFFFQERPELTSLREQFPIGSMLSGFASANQVSAT